MSSLYIHIYQKGNKSSPFKQKVYFMKISSKSITALATATVLFFPCKESDKKETAQAEEESHGIDIHFMDTTVSPKQDFYTYVNGTWMEETEIPEDRKSWGSFIE